MYELRQVGRQTYYVDCPAKIGIYAQTERDIYLIDSGNDREAARKVLRMADARGWSVRGILNTHSHADHIGGNAHIQAKTGCPIFCAGAEAGFTRHPFLEPSFLFGGYPCAALRNKFLMARESAVQDLASPDFPREIEAIPLPGHSFDMVGFRTPDGTVFLADSLCSPDTLRKYGIPFLYDVAAHLATLAALPALPGSIFVPSHAEPCADPAPLAALNRENIFETERLLRHICAVPRTFDQILAEVFRHFRLNMNLGQYALVGSTVRSFLAWMADSGAVTHSAADSLLLWHTVE